MAQRTGLLDAVTPRRLVTTALLILVVVLCVVGLQSVKDTRAATCGSPDGPVVHYFPCPGDNTLRQSQIGVVMTPGLQVDLYVDNTPIPKDQMTIEGTTFFFTPGPGTATGALAPGTHSARIVYYRSLADEATGTSARWTFSTH